MKLQFRLALVIAAAVVSAAHATSASNSAAAPQSVAASGSWRQLQANATICPTGFRGPRCLSCADGFFPKVVHSGSFQLECESCPSRAVAYLQLLGGLLLGAVSMVYMCYVGIKYALVKDSAFVPLAKVAVGFLQTVSLARFFQITWTPELAALWAATDGVATTSTYLGGAHCLGWDNTSGWRATAVAQLLVPLILVVPIMLFVVALVRAACAGCCSPAKAPVQPSSTSIEGQTSHVGKWNTQAAAQGDSSAEHGTPGSSTSPPAANAATAPESANASAGGKTDATAASATYVSTYTDNAIACAVIIAWSLYVNLAATAYSFMACLRIGGVRSLIRDPNFLCDSDNSPWMSGIGLPSFVLYAVGIPALFAYLLYINRNNLKDEQTLHRYGFLYASFKDASWYWSIAVMLRKLVVVLFITAIAPCGVGIQSMSIVMDLGLAHIAHDRSKPYRLPLLNLLESLSLLFTAVALTASTAIVDGAAVKTDITAQTSGWIVGQTAIFTLAIIGLIVWAHLKLDKGVGPPGSMLGPEAPPSNELSAKTQLGDKANATTSPPTSVVPAPVQASV